jgi:uncharacterized membrane protein
LASRTKSAPPDSSARPASLGFPGERVDFQVAQAVGVAAFLAAAFLAACKDLAVAVSRVALGVGFQAGAVNRVVLAFPAAQAFLVVQEV